MYIYYRDQIKCPFHSWYETRKAELELMKAKVEVELAEGEISRLSSQVFNDVMVRNWSHPEWHFFIRCTDLTTCEAFLKAVQTVLQRPPAKFTLYFLPKDQKWTEAREKITDTETLEGAPRNTRITELWTNGGGRRPTWNCISHFGNEFPCNAGPPHIVLLTRRQ